MRTVLIDRSFINMDFDLHSEFLRERRATFMYAESLVEAGASYVEVDSRALSLLPEPTGAERYIFRITEAWEYPEAIPGKFAYAVVPLRFHNLLPLLSVPAILEIDLGSHATAAGGDIFSILQLISSEADLSNVGMIRLVGDFDADTIPAIIAKYKRRTVIPIDFCPTNTSLSALESVIAAFMSCADAVTVGFGDYERFASLEELIIMLAAVYKTRITPHYLAGICKASIFLSMIATENADKASNLCVMIRRYMHRPCNIETIDLPADCTEPLPWKPPTRPLTRSGTQAKNTPVARVLRSMGIEQEMSDKIMEVIDLCTVGLNSADISDIIKILDDKDFKQ
jgi:hypothetical protein